MKDPMLKSNIVRKTLEDKLQWSGYIKPRRQTIPQKEIIQF